MRFLPPSGRTSPSWTDAGPPVLNTSAPAISMAMGPATPTGGRESPEVNLENIVEGSRVRQAPAVTEIDRQMLERLLEDLDLDERYAALEDEDLADTQIESEEEPDSAYMLTSVTSMASGYSFITCSPQDEPWHPDTGTESSDDEEYDEDSAQHDRDATIPWLRQCNSPATGAGSNLLHRIHPVAAHRCGPTRPVHVTSDHHRPIA